MISVPDTPDVLVVGAGPAGTTTATLLARRGWSVVLADRARFPRPKPCGEFLSPGVVRSMERMGLSLAGVRSGAGVVRGWCLDLDGTVLSVDFGERGGGMSLPRAAFDEHLLLLARREGVHVLEGAAYVSSRPTPTGGGTPGGTGSPALPRKFREHGDGERRLVVTRVDGGTRTFRARTVVGAGGLRCPVAAEMGLARRGSGVPKISLTSHVVGVRLPADRGRLILRGDLTVGLAPSDPGGRMWNATVVVPASAYGRAIARDGARAFYLHCLSVAGLDGAAWSGALPEPLASGPFDRPAGPLYRGRVLLVGDAAGYYDPFTGQGLYQALRSAELAAPLLHRVLSGSLSRGRAFGRYQRIVGRERRSTRALQVQVDRVLASPSGRAATSRTLTRAPSLLAAIMKATTDCRTPGAALLELVRRALVADGPGPRAPEAMIPTASRSTP